MCQHPVHVCTVYLFTVLLLCSLTIRSQPQKESDQSVTKKDGHSHKRALKTQFDEEESYEMIQHEQPRSTKTRSDKACTLESKPHPLHAAILHTRTLPYRRPMIEEESYVAI